MVRVRLRMIVIPMAACATAVLAATGGAAPNRPATTLAGNEHAARLDASQLLASVQVPPGAARLSAEPAGDGGRLKPTLGLSATTARADVHAWWSVSGSPESVLGYIEANPPAGSARAGTGTAYYGQSGGSVEIVTYTRPPVTGVLGSREVQVWVTSLPGNATGVLAQAESVWIVPRPADERIPKGVREVDITSARLNGATTVSLAVTKPVQVRQIASLFDGMPIAQLGAYSCPAMLLRGARVMTFRFRGRAGTSVLAQATYTEFPHLSASGPCSPVDFAIRGRSQHPLVGGDFLTEIGRIVGASLTGG